MLHKDKLNQQIEETKKQLEKLQEELNKEDQIKTVYERYPTWESLEINQGYYLDSLGRQRYINHQGLYGQDEMACVVPSERHLRFIRAFCKLSHIIEEWNSETIKGRRSWTIEYNKLTKNLCVDSYYEYVTNPLSFNSEELARQSEVLHKQLWKDYFMID